MKVAMGAFFYGFIYLVLIWLRKIVLFLQFKVVLFEHDMLKHVDSTQNVSFIIPFLTL